MLTFIKQRWLDLGISWKIGSALGCLLLISLACAITSSLQTSHTNEQLNHAHHVLISASQLSQNASSLFSEELRRYEDAIMTGEEQFLEQASQLSSQLDETLQRLQQLTRSFPLPNLSIKAVRRDLRVYTTRAKHTYQQLIQASDASNNQVVDQAIYLGQKAETYTAQLKELEEFYHQRLSQGLIQVNRATKHQQWLETGLFVLALVLTIILSLLFTRIITRPIVKLADTAQRIKEGHWSNGLQASGADEVASLTRSFSAMLQELRRREEDLTDTVCSLEESNQELDQAHSALEQSEEKYRHIFDATNESIIIYDVETSHIVDVNQSLVSALGYSREELLQMRLGQLSSNEPPYTVEYLHDFFRRSVSAGPQIFEWQVRCKDQSLLDAEVSLICTTINQRQVYVVVVRDISERKRAAAEKLELERRLQQAEKMEAMGTMAGGIAHDFNNLLAPIIGYAQLLQMNAAEEMEEKHKKQLGEIIKSGQRGQEMIQHILAFSRKGSVEKVVMDSFYLIKDATKMLAASLPKNVTLVRHFSEKSGKIIADATQIHQVVMNLGINGAHAMAGQDGNLTITTGPFDIKNDDDYRSYQLKKGTYCKLTVQDEGSGIKAEHLHRIYEPFFTTKKQGEGTGLGLSMVHGIVKDHGGNISVISRPGEGTIFTVLLPTVTAETSESFHHSTGPDQLARGSGHILVVDDDEQICGMYEDMLTVAGYQATITTTPEQCLAAAKQPAANFDLLLSDVRMPGMDGAELCRQIRETNATIPIILCSGQHEPLSKELLLKLKISQLLAKPIEPRQLLMAVQQTLQHQSIDS